MEIFARFKLVDSMVRWISPEISAVSPRLTRSNASANRKIELSCKYLTTQNEVSPIIPPTSNDINRRLPCPPLMKGMCPSSLVVPPSRVARGKSDAVRSYARRIRSVGRERKAKISVQSRVPNPDNSAASITHLPCNFSVLTLPSLPKLKSSLKSDGCGTRFAQNRDLPIPCAP